MGSLTGWSVPAGLEAWMTHSAGGAAVARQGPGDVRQSCETGSALRSLPPEHRMGHHFYSPDLSPQVGLSMTRRGIA